MSRKSMAFDTNAWTALIGTFAARVPSTLLVRIVDTGLSRYTSQSPSMSLSPFKITQFTMASLATARSVYAKRDQWQSEE